MLDKNKKLLFLCGYKSLYGGNFIPSLMALEDKLKTYGVNCMYAFPQEAQSRPWISFLKSEGKQLTFFDFDLPNREFIDELTRVVKEHQINYIHSHFAPILKVELFAKKHKDIHVFVHIHSDFSAGKFSVKKKMKNFLLYKFFSGNVTFFGVSKAFVNYNPQKINYVANCLAKRRVLSSHVGGKAIREEYNITEKEILCEIFGWSPIVKGLDIAINAVKILNEERGLVVKLAIICGREMTVTRMKKWIANNTKCSGEENYLIYWEPMEDVFSYHEAADILLSTSRSEGFSYSILEMLSLGKRCVVSDIPGIRWAEEYETVFAFSSESTEGCVEAICNALKSKKECNMKVAEAIQKNYSIDIWTNTIAEKMNQVI